MKYVFTVPHRQFKPGDAVPENWDYGVVQTMLQTHRVREVKMIDEPPADKMLLPERLKRKGVA